MWRLCGGRRLRLDGAVSVVVILDGEGSLNGMSVEKGDRLVIVDEVELFAEGTLSAIVCFKPE
jgi:hypothetical protein